MHVFTTQGQLKLSMHQLSNRSLLQIAPAFLVRGIARENPVDDAPLYEEISIFLTHYSPVITRDGYMRLLRSKLMYRVAFPFDLKLGAAAAETCPAADALYTLLAVIVHVGSGLDHGQIYPRPMTPEPRNMPSPFYPASALY